MSRVNLEQLEPNAFMTLPTNYELITPEIAKMKPEGMKAKHKDGRDHWSLWTHERFSSFAFDDWFFSAPVGTTAMLTTEAPKAGECDGCQGNTIHREVAGLKEKPEGLIVFPYKATKWVEASNAAPANVPSVPVAAKKWVCPDCYKSDHSPGEPCAMDYPVDGSVPTDRETNALKIAESYMMNVESILPTPEGAKALRIVRLAIADAMQKEGR